MEKFRIELCGEIGAGKTTLTKLLQANGYSVQFDRFFDNPFWKDLFERPASKNMFESEITFALLHYNSARNAPNQLTICDWCVFQDLSYAEVNLTNEEYVEFRKLYYYILRDIGYPRKVIYLRCNAKTLLERIDLRGRVQDRRVTKDYLERCISNLEKHLEIANVTVIDSDKIDFSPTGEHKDVVLSLVKEIIDAIESG